MRLTQCFRNAIFLGALFVAPHLVFAAPTFWPLNNTFSETASTCDNYKTDLTRYPVAAQSFGTQTLQFLGKNKGSTDAERKDQSSWFVIPLESTNQGPAFVSNCNGSTLGINHNNSALPEVGDTLEITFSGIEIGNENDVVSLLWMPLSDQSLASLGAPNGDGEAIFLSKVETAPTIEFTIPAFYEDESITAGRPNLAFQVVNYSAHDVQYTITIRNKSASHSLSTTTTLTSSLNPSVIGQQVVFTATVTASDGTSVPTGTVYFFDGANEIGHAELSEGEAQLTVAALALGSHTVTARYRGDMMRSESSPLIQVVQSTPNITLRSSGSPSKFGDPVTFTARVTEATRATPLAGQINFYIDDGIGGVSHQGLVNGVAKLTVSNLPVGKHKITGYYVAHGSINPLPSPPLFQVIKPNNDTVTSLTTNVASARLGQSVRLNVLVKPRLQEAQTIPHGKVEFKDGSQTIAKRVLQTGEAVFFISSLAPGNHRLTATFVPEDNFHASTSPAVNVAIDGNLPCTKMITTAAELQAMQDDLAASYCLSRDIDARAISNFVPVGNRSHPFTGAFNGQDHVISNLTIVSDQDDVGLFGTVRGAAVRNVTVVNANISSSTSSTSPVGIIAGYSESGLSRLHVHGAVHCLQNCQAGGLVGEAAADVMDSSSSAAVTSATGHPYGTLGGLIGGGVGRIVRSYATGLVSCGAFNCLVGGLVGSAGYEVSTSYATGAVFGGDNSYVGGLAGASEQTIDHCYSAGSVTAGINAKAGSLVGQQIANTSYSYAVGRVTSAGGVSAKIGGLIGYDIGQSVTSSYWDKSTTHRSTSATGIGLRTALLRAAPPLGFSDPWAITKGLSYPYLDDPAFDFTSPLATLVSNNNVFVFLPISQRLASEFNSPAAHRSEASLAATYTIIARAIGMTRNIAALRDAKIDSFFWNDATQTSTWTGPVTALAALSATVAIPPAATLGPTNVIGAMNSGKLVVLRGSYQERGRGVAKHWMLGTLYTRTGDNVPDAIYADDPWTGTQVQIDPATKKVISPANFPLKQFVVDGYATVTLH